MLVLTVRNADGTGRLLKARVQAGILGSPRAFGKGEVKSTPRAVVTSAAGRIVVGDASGQLTFYNPIDGTVELAMDTELKDLAALAVSPTTGNLYVADFDGGICRVDDASKPGQPAVRTVKVADAARPTSIAFAPDGSLYVTSFGTGEADGALSVLSGDF
jgi:DNA-binding beta-propeller fold protein YncE